MPSDTAFDPLIAEFSPSIRPEALVEAIQKIEQKVIGVLIDITHGQPLGLVAVAAGRQRPQC